MIPKVLTIAGSDSGGGAGIQADLKTITALGAFGSSAITALTAQNTAGVRGILGVPPEFVGQQIDAIMEDIGADAAKTGMLARRPVIEVVVDRVRRHGIRPLVVDPVMVAQSGHSLLEDDAQAAMRDLVLPLAAVATPNLPEAAALAGMVGSGEGRAPRGRTAGSALGRARLI
jgi:hydroxymethylpyrimidine/phosphomethylpyrimidine kinase